MEQLFMNFLGNASNVQKGFFLMCAGVGFVFSVQFIFYLVVKLWTR